MNRPPEDRADAARPDAPDQGQILPGLAVEGTLRGRGDLRLEGPMRGAISLEGNLIVGPQGQVTAPIRARRVEIHGELVGDIEAAHVAVRSGGWVAGDVRAASIAIDDGATLEGLVDMDFDDARLAANRGAR